MLLFLDRLTAQALEPAALRPRPDQDSKTEAPQIVDIPFAHQFPKTHPQKVYSASCSKEDGSS